MHRSSTRTADFSANFTDILFSADHALFSRPLGSLISFSYTHCAHSASTSSSILMKLKHLVPVGPSPLGPRNIHLNMDLLAYGELKCPVVTPVANRPYGLEANGTPLSINSNKWPTLGSVPLGRNEPPTSAHLC